MRRVDVRRVRLVWRRDGRCIFTKEECCGFERIGGFEEME